MQQRQDTSASQHLASSLFIYTHSSILYVRASSACRVRAHEHGKLAAAHAEACMHARVWSAEETDENLPSVRRLALLRGCEGKLLAAAFNPAPSRTSCAAGSVTPISTRRLARTAAA
jgi:hypothetical protein